MCAEAPKHQPPQLKRSHQLLKAISFECLETMRIILAWLGSDKDNWVGSYYLTRPENPVSALYPVTTKPDSPVSDFVRTHDLGICSLIGYKQFLEIPRFPLQNGNRLRRFFNCLLCVSGAH